ncbi:hypothetical protein J6590_101585, partial [Homalodisca vitripennis]
PPQNKSRSDCNQSHANTQNSKKCLNTPFAKKSETNKEFGTFRVQDSPPITAKLLENNETYEDFLNKHLKEISTLQRTPSNTASTTSSSPIISLEMNKNLNISCIGQDFTPSTTTPTTTPNISFLESVALKKGKQKLQPQED